MGTLYLVRHGQASFGAEDYDNLSELGHRQSVRLGEYFAGKGLEFDTVLTGTLKRHAQTWSGIAQGAGLTLQPTLWPGLNEYDSEAVIATLPPHSVVPTTWPASKWRSCMAAAKLAAPAPSATLWVSV